MVNISIYYKMAYTLPWSVNKLVSTNINASDSVTGTYGSVSLKVNGKSELVGDSIIDGKLGIGTNVTANKVEVSGNIGCTELISTQNTITATTSSTTILNPNFATPAQSTNNFSTIASPYSSITNWTITTVTGSAYTIFVGNGFTALVNTLAISFPDYPLFNQYLSFQGSTTSQMTVTQNISFAVGSYLFSCYGWGEYNRYSTTMTLGISCGTGSVSNLALVEQGWTKLTMKFKITPNLCNIV